MRAVKIWTGSGFVSPLFHVNGEYPRTDVRVDGDDDATFYHTLPGLTFRNYMDAKKTIEIARKAVSLFGGTDLFNFIHANMQYNRFKSDLHYRFLQDTLEFIKTGKRGMSIHTWMSLLSVKEETLTKKVVAKTAYSMKSDLYRNVSVMQWLSHEGGLQDLVISLYIIFGKY